MYRVWLYPIDEKSDNPEWAAEIPDLPGCVGGGKTPEEALSMLNDAKEAWLETAKELKRKIPEPNNPYDSEYSGKFTLRIPKTLHRELTLEAEEQGISLNQYLLFLITRRHYQEKNTQKQEVVLVNSPAPAREWQDRQQTQSSFSYNYQHGEYRR